MNALARAAAAITLTCFYAGIALAVGTSSLRSSGVVILMAILFAAWSCSMLLVWRAA